LHAPGFFNDLLFLLAAALFNVLSLLCCKSRAAKKICIDYGLPAKNALPIKIKMMVQEKDFVLAIKITRSFMTPK